MSESTASAKSTESSTPRRSVFFFYGLPGLVTAIPTIPVYTLLPVFYAGEVGLGLTLTGLMLFLSRGLDIFTDPLIGRLVDAFGAKGIRQLLVLGAAIAAPSLVLLLSPPEGAGGAWLLLFSALLYLGWTLVQVPYLAWGARLSDNYNVRTKLAASRETAVIIGILVSGSLPAVLGLFAYSESERMSALGWITVLLGLPVFILMARRVPLPRPFSPAAHDWKDITRNGLFTRLLSAWFLNGLANAIPAILFPLYCAHVLATDDQTRNLLLAVYFSSAVLCMPAWLLFSRKLGKQQAWCLAMLVTCPAFSVAAFLGSGDTLAFTVVCILTGACLGADMALPPALQADVADWDRLKFRRNRTAALFSLWNMAGKFSLAMAAGVLLPLAAAMGIEQDSPPAAAITGLAMIYALPACVFKLSAVALVRRLPLTARRQQAIAVRLQRRDRQGAMNTS